MPSLDAVLERLESWPSYIGAPHGMALVFVLKRLLAGADGAPGALELLRNLEEQHIIEGSNLARPVERYLRAAVAELAALLGMSEEPTREE